MLGYLLYGAMSRRSIEYQFRTAEDALKDGDYLNAIKGFEGFVASYPTHEYASKARVHRAMADVQQYVSGGNPVWTEALATAKKSYDEVRELPEFEDSQAELAELVLKIGVGLTDRAKAGADRKSLDEARRAMELHGRVAGPSAKGLQIKAKWPDKFREAELAVAKGGKRTAALAAMDAGIQSKSAAKVFAARDELLAAYPDLAADRGVVDRLRKGNELLRSEAVYDETQRSALTQPVDDPLGASTTFVLRSLAPSQTAADASAPLVYALADGFVFGLDGSNGAPLWQVPLRGRSFPPLPVVGGGEPSVLVFDGWKGELLRLKARTGDLIWRLTLGEAVNDAPLVLGNQLFQATPGGKLIRIDLVTGKVLGTLDLKRPLTRSPVADEQGKYLYVLADEASLFVLSREPLACVAVEYVGHDPGAIACSPLRVGRYLFVSENHTPERSRCRVWLLDETDPRAREIQQIPVEGWTWSPPTTLGAKLWLLSDRGAVAAWGIGQYDEKEPFKRLATTTADPKPSGPAFARARTERELWVSSGRTARYDLEANDTRIVNRWNHVGFGPALAPIQQAGRLAVFIHQATDTGGVSVYGIEPADGKIAWRTTLGAPWPANPTPTADGSALAVVGLDGSSLKVSREGLAKGGFVQAAIPEAGHLRLPGSGMARLEIEGLEVVVPKADSGQIYVREGGQAEIRPVELPAPLATTPLWWDRDLLVACVDGRVYLIDPKNGGSKADPYVPPYDKSKPIKWLKPLATGGDSVVLTDASGRLRRLVRKTDPRPILAAGGEEVDLAAPIVADPILCGESILVATDDGKIRSLSARDLTPIDTWTLEAPIGGGPYGLGAMGLVVDTAGGAFAVGEDGRKRWGVKFEEGPPIGAPILAGDTIVYVSRDAGLHRRAVTDGSPREALKLPIAAIGGPIALGDSLLVPVGPGALRLLPAGR